MCNHCRLIKCNEGNMRSVPQEEGFSQVWWPWSTTASKIIQRTARNVLAISLLSAIAYPAYAEDFTYGNGDVRFPSLDMACRYVVGKYNEVRNSNHPYTRPVPDGGGWNCAFLQDFYNNGKPQEYTAGFVGRRGDSCAAPKLYDPVAHSCDNPPVPCPAGSERRTPGGVCIPTVPEPNVESQGPSNGPSCSGQIPDPSCGQPINPGNGNMWHVESDYAAVAIGNLALSRTYNSNLLSLDAKRVNLFGNRWTTAYDAVLRQEVPTAHNAPVGLCVRFSDTKKVACEAPAVAVQAAIPDAVSVSRGDGKRIFFNRSGSVWVPSSNVNDSISPVFNTNASAVVGWLFKAAAGDTTEEFDADGKLLSITAADGTSRRMTYSANGTYDTYVAKYPANAPSCASQHPGEAVDGRLLCVTDDWGRQLAFEYDAKGRVARMVDPAGENFLYRYDGASSGCLSPTSVHYQPVCASNNLTSVVYPGSKTRTYHYNEAAQINGGNSCPNLVPVAYGLGPFANALTRITDENAKRHVTWSYDCDGRATSSHVGAGAERVDLAYGTRDANGNAVTTVKHLAGTPENPLSARTRTRGLIRAAWNADRTPLVLMMLTETRTFSLTGRVCAPSTSMT
jgi:YD repeat-containing protein